MGETKLVIPILQPGAKVVGSAYLTQEGEIVFSPHKDAAEFVLVEPHPLVRDHQLRQEGTRRKGRR